MLTCIYTLKTFVMSIYAIFGVIYLVFCSIFGVLSLPVN